MATGWFHRKKRGKKQSKEIETPYGFRLDTSPSPLHPALQANILGVNPFRSQRWDVSQMRNPTDQLERFERVLCSLLQTTPKPSHTFTEVGSNPVGDSICTAPFAGNLGMSTLTACMEEAWREKNPRYRDVQLLWEMCFLVKFLGAVISQFRCGMKITTICRYYSTMSCKTWGWFVPLKCVCLAKLPYCSTIGWLMGNLETSIICCCFVWSFLYFALR